MSPKVKLIARLKFELASYDVHTNHYVMGTLPRKYLIGQVNEEKFLDLGYFFVIII